MIEASVHWTDKDRYVGRPLHALHRHGYRNRKDRQQSDELVLLGLCGCTASDVVGILRKKREPFTALEVSAEAERADATRPFIPRFT